MALRLGDEAPNFQAETTEGNIDFHEWIGDSWAVLFSHPADYTPVCTTEFGAVAQLSDEWAKRGTKVIGISVDDVADHMKWKSDIETYAGLPAKFPIIDDKSLKVAKLYDMLPAEAWLKDGRTPADTATVRSVFIIGPDKKVRLMMTYPMSVGRNFAEVLRALDVGRVHCRLGRPHRGPRSTLQGRPTPLRSTHHQSRVAGGERLRRLHSEELWPHQEL